MHYPLVEKAHFSLKDSISVPSVHQPRISNHLSSYGKIRPSLKQEGKGSGSWMLTSRMVPASSSDRLRRRSQVKVSPPGHYDTLGCRCLWWGLACAVYSGEDPWLLLTGYQEHPYPLCQPNTSLEVVKYPLGGTNHALLRTTGLAQERSKPGSLNHQPGPY